MTLPPTTHNSKLRCALLASAILMTLSSGSVFAKSGEIIDKNYLLNDPAEGEYDEYRLTLTQDEEFSGISLPDFNPPSQHDQYDILVNNGAKVEINGNTFINSYTDKQGSWPEGTLAITAKEGAQIHLNGDVKIYVQQLKAYSQHGANVLYADGTKCSDEECSKFVRSEITVGTRDSSTILWALAQKPDLISAKNGGTVTIKSTRNQLIGNIDTLGIDFGSKGSTVTGTFSGSDSFWFGDEQTFQNFDQIDIVEHTTGVNILIDSKDKLNSLIKRDYDTLLEGYSEQDKEAAIPVIGYILTMLGINKESEVSDKIELVFENGAQWTYFGDGSEYKASYETADATFKSTAKRVSAITLNGGIINLFDENIQGIWNNTKDINGDSLLSLWEELGSKKHDYVRIGDLKGNGGIFRLDLDSDNKKNSDMVFVESSSTGGTHFIEPYRPQDLASVSDTNRLTFALVAANKDGSDSVSFADKQNIYGESLFDYELGISSEAITEENIQDFKKLVDENYQIENFDINDYLNGTHWYINRLLVKESAASIGMRSAGYASYDLAVSMDRRDRRLHNTVFQDGQKDGLWARIQYGENGAEHLYDADLTTVYVGYEKATSADNRLGFSFGYTDGSTDFNDVKGNGDLKRYEASVYDTLTFGSHYLDFVGRIGQVENDFDVTNQTGKLSTSGSFDQKYAALSVEYGFNYKDEHNVFIEPQLQLQAAYLDSYSYHTERNMKVKADSDISLIGRAGVRAGKSFEASNYAGEIYARADVLHQFTDGQDADFSDLSNKVGVTWGDKDTWATFGIGSYFNWNDKMSFQVDIERTAGGETIDTWLISGRANYLF